MTTTFTLWVRDEKLAYDRDLMMAVLMKERDNMQMQIPVEIREYLLGTRRGHLSFDVKRSQKEGGYNVKITLEPLTGALQEVEYEEDIYALFEEIQGFMKEIERSKKSILRSTYKTPQTRFMRSSPLWLSGQGTIPGNYAPSPALAYSAVNVECLLARTWFRI